DQPGNQKRSPVGALPVVDRAQRLQDPSERLWSGGRGKPPTRARIIDPRCSPGRFPPPPERETRTLVQKLRFGAFRAPWVPSHPNPLIMDTSRNTAANSDLRNRAKESKAHRESHFKAKVTNLFRTSKNLNYL